MKNETKPGKTRILNIADPGLDFFFMDALRARRFVSLLPKGSSSLVEGTIYAVKGSCLQYALSFGTSRPEGKIVTCGGNRGETPIALVPHIPSAFIRMHDEPLSVVVVCVNNEDCPGLYPVIRNSLPELAPYPGKYRALHQIGASHCHSLFSELRPLPVVVQ